MCDTINAEREFIEGRLLERMRVGVPPGSRQANAPDVCRYSLEQVGT